MARWRLTVRNDRHHAALKASEAYQTSVRSAIRASLSSVRWKRGFSVSITLIIGGMNEGAWPCTIADKPLPFPQHESRYWS